jgi:hypothetical protein
MPKRLPVCERIVMTQQVILLTKPPILIESLYCSYCTSQMRMTRYARCMMAVPILSPMLPSTVVYSRSSFSPPHPRAYHATRLLVCMPHCATYIEKCTHPLPPTPSCTPSLVFTVCFLLHKMSCMYLVLCVPNPPSNTAPSIHLLALPPSTSCTTPSRPPLLC